MQNGDNYMGDRFLSSAGAGRGSTLPTRTPDPSAVLDKNHAPMGPKHLSNTGAGGSLGMLLRHFHTPVLYWINFCLRLKVIVDDRAQGRSCTSALCPHLLSPLLDFPEPKPTQRCTLNSIVFRSISRSNSEFKGQQNRGNRTESL